MTGKAHAHWRRWITEDKSIQKNDYVGEKFYIHSNRTLWGHLYRTPTIRNVGNNFVFGGAVGDGCIYIPCRTFEGLHKDSPMTVVLRVCDSDRKSADNNLGELMINAKELVQRGGISAFQLSIHGHPGKSTIKLSARFEDETIECRHRDIYHKCATAMSSEVLVLTVHSISGINVDDIPKGSDTLREITKNIHVEAWRSKELYLSKSSNVDVMEPFFEKPLPSGTMTFSFSFPTSADIPGSAVVKAGEMSGIFYYITLKISKRRGDSVVHLPVYILPLRHMPTLRLLAPEEWNGEPVPMCEHRSVCCRRANPSDTVEITMSLDRTAYAPGERMRMDESQIINNSRKSADVRIVLNQWSSLSVPIDKVKACRKFLLYKSKCNPYTIFRLHGTHIQMPNVSPSIFDSNTHEPVCITYTLALEVKAFEKKVSQELPILVCPFPPSKDSIAKARKLYPSKEPICNEIELEDSVPINTEEEISLSKDQESIAVNVVGLLSKQRDIKIPKKFSTNAESCQFSYHPKVLVTSTSSDHHAKLTHSKKKRSKHKHVASERKFTPPAEMSSPHHLHDIGTLNYKYRKGFKFSLPFNIPFITNNAY
jgi:hypothetical protein